jgi:hypothetical protein
MTGRELIIYILQHNLEDEIVFKDGFFLGFMDEKEAAAKFNVGVATIRAWYATGMIKGVKFGDSLYFLKNIADPRANIK